MNGLRILLLCVAAAFICASIRTMHPQIAAAVALACGTAAIMLSVSDIDALSQSIKELVRMTSELDAEAAAVLKLSGIALLAEFASDICSDSGEKALANRIDTGVRISIAAASLPIAGKIMKQIVELTS